MRFQWLGVLKLRHPKSREEWRVKILVAFVLALVLEVAALSGNIDIGTKGAWGTYTPATDEIWIDPELDKYGTMVVTAHEEAHQAFYYLLPFWSLVKIPTAGLVIFISLLGLLIISRRLLYVAGCLLFVTGITEVHAYGITLLMFGVSEYTLPGLLVYGTLPLVVCVAVWLTSRFKKESKPKFKARYERFSRKDRRRLAGYTAVENCSILMMGFLIGYVMFVSGFTWPVVLFMFVDFLISCWSKKKQRQMGVWITKRIRVRAKRKGRLRHAA